MQVFPSMHQALGSIPSTTLLPINLFWIVFASSGYSLNCTTSLIEPEGLGGTWHAADSLNICGSDAPRVPVCTFQVSHTSQWPQKPNCGSISQVW